MDGTTTVPIVWLVASVVGLATLLLSAFTWWLRVEWKRNWEEHALLRQQMKVDHDELDERIDKHHEKVDKALTRLHKRIDWMIMNMPGVPAYVDEDHDDD